MNKSVFLYQYVLQLIEKKALSTVCFSGKANLAIIRSSNTPLKPISESPLHHWASCRDAVFI